MPSRSPAEYFCKYLLSKKDTAIDGVLRALEDYGIYGVTANYLKKLAVKMEPRPEPWNPVSREAKMYLKEHGIHDLWFPTAAVKEAYYILSVPELRNQIEQLLLSPLRVEELVEKLNERHNSKLTVDGIKAFGHYFWNKSLLTTQEWVEFLESRPMAPTNISILRSSPDMAQSFVPWVTGLSGMSDSFNTGVVSRRIRDVAFMKILEIERQPATLAHSKMMKNYMDVIKEAEDQMRNSDVALRDVLSAFERFRLRNNSTGTPSVTSVAGENFSQSGKGTDIKKNLLEEFDAEQEESEDDDG